MGFVLAERIVQLMLHFYSAPALQVFGYIVLFLKDEGLTSDNHRLVEQIICCIDNQTKRTDHHLALEIANKRLAVPSYCLSNDDA